MNKMMIGPAWKKGGASPFDNLDKEGLNLEITLRNDEMGRIKQKIN